MSYQSNLTEEEKQELLHNMLESSMPIQIKDIDERLLNAWIEVFKLIKN